ncbi:uncharacterized protein LOC135077169 [Ostrinia nubilalis]
MAKEDLLLPVEMGKLEIEPIKTNKPMKEDNPFINKSQQKNIFSRSYASHSKCTCPQQKNYMTICKKKHNKVIRDPVLKIIKTCSKDSSVLEEGCIAQSKGYPLSRTINADVLNLCALVDNCNQLRISSDVKKQNVTAKEVNSKNNWWKNDISLARQTKQSVPDKSQTGTCSQQALNPPCDVTIDELASYFETLVHIPKKMSSMAEMMYI